MKFNTRGAFLSSAYFASLTFFPGFVISYICALRSCSGDGGTHQWHNLFGGWATDYGGTQHQTLGIRFVIVWGKKYRFLEHRGAAGCGELIRNCMTEIDGANWF